MCHLNKETGGSYPEIDKLINLCEIFNYSIDEILKGKITEKKEQDLKTYDNFMNKFGSFISIGIFIILLGITTFLIYLGIEPDIKNIETKTIITGVALMLIFIFIAIPIFIINGLKLESFKKKYPTITENYTNEEIEKFDKKFALIIASSVSLTLLGIISLVLIYGLKIYKNEVLPVGIFMIFITISIPILVYFCLQKK